MVKEYESVIGRGVANQEVGEKELAEN